MVYYYIITMVLSVGFSGIYLWKYGKKTPIHFVAVFLMIPMINLGYLKLATSKSVGEALLANSISYLDGCYLQLFYLLYLASFCKVQINRAWRLLMFSFSSMIYAFVLTAGDHKLMYKAVKLVNIRGVSTLEKDYGPIHTVYYVMLGIYLLLNLSILLYGSRKKDVSRKNLGLLFFLYFVTFLSFILGRDIIQGLDLLPLSFNVAQIVFLIILHRLGWYDIADTVVDTLIEEEEVGFISFDRKRTYLGCSAFALSCFPDLQEMYVDRPLTGKSEMVQQIGHWMDDVDQDKEGTSRSDIVERGNISYKVTTGYLYQEKKRIGYQLRIEDCTKEQAYVSLLNNYNANLEKEVQVKTENIQNIMNQFIMGMAEMVQNRDNNTGGHIKRTSFVVRLLANEILLDNRLHLSESFLTDLTKAAPMHDLGKIAVDDAILRKPGKFTDEEFAIMKTHAEKGAQIVETILGDVDDPQFVKIAANVAHYHHERYDGRGYPTGLAGQDIPIEARIMAVADVYDALVSKRCYKEAFSFEKAYSIIEEGMGTQFDPELDIYFNRARTKIEEYYSKA